MTQRPGTVIEVRGLSKRYGDVRALDGVDFDVREGELFGFLGPNGAGKTTAINLLTGLARPDAGAVRMAGVDVLADPKAAQSRIGVVPDESNLYPELTGFENLAFCGALYGMRRRERQARARELLDRVGLAAAGHRRFGGYSRGMKRKLAIAAGIVHEPPILFLDEPTTGIDVAGARQIRALIAGLHAAGVTVFLTTHYIEEAERLCRRIAFLVAGRIVRIDSIENLMQRVAGRHAVEFAVSGGGAGLCAAAESAFPGLRCRIVSPGRLRVEGPEPVRVGPIVRCLEDRGADISEARKLRPTLEEVFVDITGIERMNGPDDARGPGP